MSSPNTAARVGDIPGFPFDDFEQLQAAVAIKSFNIGVDPLAAAEWSSRFNGLIKRSIITGLSLLLVAAGVASIIAAFLTREYLLLLTIPIQAFVFYVSQPSSKIRPWVTAGGAISILAFLDLLLNGYPLPATLVAYGGLTFAAVRAAGYLANSSFRKALLLEEELFLEAFAAGSCTLRNNRTKRVYRS
jgi:hypothetical protein